MAEALWPSLVFLGFVICQRLGELVLARANTARLLAAGAHEVGSGHYPVMVALHAAWVLSLVVWGVGQPILSGWLAAYVLLQAARIWVLGTLGRRWTTRIIVTDTPLVLSGPFRYVRHPNYLLVICEIVVAPMVLGLWGVALAFTVLNAAMLVWRIRVEDGALRGSATSQQPT